MITDWPWLITYFDVAGFVLSAAAGVVIGCGGRKSWPAVGVLGCVAIVMIQVG